MWCLSDGDFRAVLLSQYALRILKFSRLSPVRIRNDNFKLAGVMHGKEEAKGNWGYEVGTCQNV